MAYNFFADLTINRNFTVTMKQRFEIIVSHMNNEYELARGQRQKIMEDFQRQGIKTDSMTQISTDTSVIKYVVRLLREGQEAQNKLRKGSQRAAQAALKIFDRLPHDVTWERITAEMEESAQLSASSEAPKQKQEAVAPPFRLHPALLELDRLLAGKDALIAELNEKLVNVQRAYEQLDERRYQALREFTSEGDENDGDELLTEQVPREDNFEALMAVYGLPTVTTKFGNTGIQYERGFRRKFKTLHPDIKRQCAKAITELATRGWKETMPSQQHEKAPRARSDVPVPKGARVSRVSSKWRYVWSSTNNDCKVKYIIVHYVGPHDMWDSQK